MTANQLVAAAAGLALMLAAGRAIAQSAFTPGNLVVVQIGEGLAPPTTAASAVFLSEIQPGDGAVVQTIAMPTAAAGAQRMFTLSGTATSEGFLSRSADGRYLTMAGYDAAPGTAAVSGSTAAMVNRVIARIGAGGGGGAGAIDTSTAFQAFSGSNIRSVASTDGARFWAAGTSSPSGTGGVHYLTLGATDSVQIASAVNNVRVVEIFAGQLYISSASAGHYGVSSVGAGLPSTAGQGVTYLPGMPAAVGPSPYGFFFADAQTLYVSDDRAVSLGGGITKWVWSGTQWGSPYTLNSGLPGGVRALTGVVVQGVTTLYAIGSESASSGVRLWKVVDAGGGGAQSPFTVVAVAPSNAPWRGIAWAPTAGGQPGACYANCDGSTTAPILNVADFTCFLQSFASGATYANCDQSTTVPVLNVADFTCFLQRFAGGCP